MALRDLSLSDWAHMSDEMARGECDAIAQALPHGATFNGLKAHAYCGREHRIARFRLGDGEEAADFVLVPGGERRSASMAESSGRRSNSLSRSRAVRRSTASISRSESSSTRRP